MTAVPPSLSSAPRRADFGLGRHFLLAVVLATVLAGGVGGWAARAPLNAAVVGSGMVKVDRELRRVQQPDGGTLVRIHAAPGDMVEAGQILLELDSREIATELGLRQSQLVELQARAARLVAERDGLPDLQPGAGFLADHPDAARALAGESLLLRQQRADRTAETALLQSRADQLQHEATALTARQTALAGQLALAETAEQRMQSLAAKGSAPLSAQEEAAALAVRLAGDLGETSARLAANAAQHREAALEMARLTQTAAFEAHRELRQIEPQMTELAQNIAALRLRLDRALIRAPEAGQLHELPVNTIGQVIAPGEILATIVPRGADLVIEFRVGTTDIDQITVGQAARLRFAAFDQRTTPELAGRITHVAPADSADPETGARHFVARAAPDPGQALPGETRLLPGMPVEVYVQTAERTALDYILQPIRDSFARGMLEE